jgi:enoyl-[acyl-carrier protein] reductase I
MVARSKALIVGAANERSLAWAIAKSLHAAGMDLGFSVQGPAVAKRVRPLAESLNAAFIQECDVTRDAEVESLFKTVGEQWGRLDVLVHSVAFARTEDLEGPFLQVSREGFALANDVSAYSLVLLARHAVPLMKKDGGSILTLTNTGSQRVIPGYHVMGVAKAALESAVRYLAYELGPSQIRVNAISAGPVKTFASMGIDGFNEMMDLAEKRSPLGAGISGEDVGGLGAFLVSPGARHITGGCIHVDSGLNILGA